MDDWRRQQLGWAARRGAVSAFLAVHLTATALWVSPDCPIRRAVIRPVGWYVIPLGMWQYWGMFAPDPMRDSVTLEAEAVDARGMRHRHEFTKVADYSWWRAIPRFRHPKFAANLMIPELEANRVVAARHVARQLDLPDEAYPLAVTLLYRVTPTPPPGAPADPMTPKYPQVLTSHTIATRAEVTP